LKWAVFSDIHGNLEAFKAVWDYISKEDIDKIAILGDIVGYGANPKECIDQLRYRADIIVAGNHDFAVTGLTDISNFNYVARTAIEWTIEQLPDVGSAFLSGLPLTSVVNDLTFVHSNPHNPQEWKYLLSLNDARNGFNFFHNRICFVGHSHIPVIFAKDSKGRVSSSKDHRIELKDGARYIINVGSVGQPRDGNPAAAFGILDTEESVFTINRAPYDIRAAQKKIIEAGLPERLAIRLAAGK